MTARAFALTTFSFAVALAMIFAIALFAAPRTAFAAEQPDSESPRGALLPANVIPSPSIIEGVSQGMRQAHQDACERVEAEKTDKTLAYDPALIAAVGNQTADGHMICCPAYACAYGDAVMTREIAAGRPTVVHVSGSWGEHWICLIGYRGASDPDDLTLDNFIALDPVYGDEIIASDGYALYGDFCQHISDAR